MQAYETQDEFGAIPGITAIASGRIGAELTFSFPEVVKAIELCTENGIAVLGIELGRMLGEGFHTNVLSGYDLGRGPNQRERMGRLRNA